MTVAVRLSLLISAFLVVLFAPAPHAQSAPEWLTWLNFYRAAAGLPAVTESAVYSDGDWKHARYTVKTDILAHSENPASPWYTPEGAAAAANSNVAATGSATWTARTAIEAWMRGPFHAVGMIDPKLRTSGFGVYSEADGGYQSAAAIDVLRGRSTVPAGVTFPIAWPGNGATVPLTTLGSELPNPLASCPTYVAPAGLPVILQLGAGGVTPAVSASSLTRSGSALEHCVFHEATYRNPNASDQSLGRSILGSRDAIMLVPRAPLVSGSSYAVSITANGSRYAWTFSIGPVATPSPCTYSVSPASASFAASGGNGGASVTAGAGCSWTAASNASWISVTSGPGGTGNGIVAYIVDANTTTATRTGTLAIAGQTVAVSQAGAAAAGGGGSFADDFGRPDSTTIGNGWTEAQGDVQIKGGELANVVTNTYHLAVLPGWSGTTVNAAASFAFSAHEGTPRFGVVLRWQDPLNYYVLYRQAGGSSVLRIARVVNGVETVLKSTTLANPAKTVFFRVGGSASGTTLTMTLDGVTKLTATDATFASGSVGLLMGSTRYHLHRADNFSAAVQ